MLPTSKLYVLVRADLSRPQQAVQAGHAVAEWCLSHAHNCEWRNGTLVYLRVRNLDELEAWWEKLNTDQASYFREPYYKDEMTAIAAVGIGEMVKDLPLM